MAPVQRVSWSGGRQFNTDRLYHPARVMLEHDLCDLSLYDSSKVFA